MLSASRTFFERKLTIVLFSCTVGMVFFLLYVTYTNFIDYHKGVEEVRRADQQRMALAGMLSSMRDAETGVRGYMLVRDEGFRQPYDRAMAGYIRSKLALDTNAVGLDRALVDSLDRTARLLQERWMYEAEALQLDTTYKLTSADMVEDKRLMDEFRRTYMKVSKALGTNRKERLQAENTTMWRAPGLVVMLTLIAVLALSVLLWRSNRALLLTEASVRVQQQKNEELAAAMHNLEHLRAELKQVLDISPNGIMSLSAVRDAKGTVIDFEFKTANAMALGIMGRTELLGKRMLQELPDQVTMHHFREYVAVVETHKELERDVERDFRGVGTWFREHAVPTADGFLLTYTDIAEQKRAERARLETDKLELTGQITRTVAHEVRNPLTNLHLALEQLQEEMHGAGGTTASYFDIMQRNLQRIGDLIKGMLESTKQREINAVPVPLAMVVEEVLLHIGDRLALKQMTAEKRIEGHLREVHIDQDLMVLALTNLAVNAIEAMEPGKGVLGFRVAQRGETLVLTISDNGKGIPEEGLKKIFQPFYSGRAGGLGLGLTTTRSILVGHGVGLEVESEVGVGTTFELLFPVALQTGRAY